MIEKKKLNDTAMNLSVEYYLT